MNKQFTKEFKEDAVRYYHEHKDLGYTVCATNYNPEWRNYSRKNCW